MSAAIQRYEPVLSTWSDGVLRSPLSGVPLHRDGPFSLAAPGERWPVLDGIPYLRLGRDTLVQAALGEIDAGETESATALLLADRAELATGSAQDHAAMLALVSEARCLSFRDAMRRLGFGAEADVFAHRWSDPVFLSGLALAECFWPARPRVVDVGCGPGHFLRAFERQTASITGADIVFANLWLARHWVAPAADLVCFDAARPWPLSDASADVVFCHDALPWFADLVIAGNEMRRVAESVLCGHVGGSRCTREEAEAAFGPITTYDDAEFTASLIARRSPRATTRHGPDSAFAFVAGKANAMQVGPVLGRFAAPPRGTPLRRNPLYYEDADGTCVRRFPSPDYASRVGPHATYPAHVTARSRIVAGADPADDALIRRRVWLDLPPRW